MDAGHTTVGDIVRHLHGELSPEKQRELEAHLHQCRSCRQRWEHMERQSATLSNVLSRAQPETPASLAASTLVPAGPGRAHSPRRRGLRAALLGALLVGTAVTVRPVRAWVVDRLRELWPPGPEAAQVSMAGTHEGEAEWAAVRFTPVSATFVLRIRTEPRAGRLVIEAAGQEPMAAAHVMSGADGSLVVRPDGIEVINTAESSASYRLILPRSVEALELHVGKLPVVRYELGEGWQPIEVELGRGKRTS